MFPNPPVSVPSSGRPISETTFFTSGKDANTRRAWFMKRVPSVRFVLTASVPRAQMEPSSRCGRNSAPMIPLKLRYAETARAATPTPTVTQRCSIAQRSAVPIALGQERHQRIDAAP